MRAEEDGGCSVAAVIGERLRAKAGAHSQKLQLALGDIVRELHEHREKVELRIIYNSKISKGAHFSSV